MGYPLEKYKLQTQDKYTLGLERIPYSKHGDQIIGKPIVLIHGLFLSSYVFVFLNESLSKLLYIMHDIEFKKKIIQISNNRLDIQFILVLFQKLSYFFTHL